MSSDDDLKNHKNLSELVVEEVAQFFCSASCDRSYDTRVGSGYLHIFWEQTMTCVGS